MQSMEITPDGDMLPDRYQRKPINAARKSNTTNSASGFGGSCEFM